MLKYFSFLIFLALLSASIVKGEVTNTVGAHRIVTNRSATLVGCYKNYMDANTQKGKDEILKRCLTKETFEAYRNPKCPTQEEDCEFPDVDPLGIEGQYETVNIKNLDEKNGMAILILSKKVKLESKPKSEICVAVYFKKIKSSLRIKHTTGVTPDLCLK